MNDEQVQHSEWEDCKPGEISAMVGQIKLRRLSLHSTNSKGISALRPAPLTPILVKDHADLPWPEDRAAFYVLASNGLFMVRRNEFFESCVPASDWPRELEEQVTFLRPRFPLLPQDAFEKVVGFFARRQRRDDERAPVDGDPLPEVGRGLPGDVNFERLHLAPRPVRALEQVDPTLRGAAPRVVRIPEHDPVAVFIE